MWDKKKEAVFSDSLFFLNYSDLFLHQICFDYCYNRADNVLDSYRDYYKPNNS